MEPNIKPGGSNQTRQNPQVGRLSPGFETGYYVRVGFCLVPDPDPAPWVGSKPDLQPGNPGPLLTLIYPQSMDFKQLGN
jgi:hypothetical protein